MPYLMALALLPFSAKCSIEMPGQSETLPQIEDVPISIIAPLPSSANVPVFTARTVLPGPSPITRAFLGSVQLEVIDIVPDGRRTTLDGGWVVSCQGLIEQGCEEEPGLTPRASTTTPPGAEPL
jgi:hypothetical protein